MRLGIYGGTFDPVHYGHLLAGEQCLEQCGLDEVWFVPASVPPHKPERSITSGVQRAEMLEIATAGHPRFRVSRLELDRSGPSYTVDTLTALRGESPGRELFLLIGTDSLADFVTWRSPQRILALATLVVVNRGRSTADLQGIRTRFGASAAERVLQVEMPAVDLASTDIRRRVHSGRSVRYMVPRGVQAYIYQHGLYR